jgi:hypothetical protein
MSKKPVKEKFSLQKSNPKITFILKSDLFCDILYIAGNRIIVSALQHRSNNPSAIGGAAVNNTL